MYYACSLTDRGLQAKMHGGAVDTAYAWEGAIRDYAEIDRLRPAKIVIDYEKTNAMLGLAHEVFDGILDVTLEGSYWWSFGLTSDLILLRGFEQVLLDMYDNPDGLHRLMAFLQRQMRLQSSTFWKTAVCFRAMTPETLLAQADTDTQTGCLSQVLTPRM